MENIQNKTFLNGEKPAVEDFKRVHIIPAVMDGDEVITPVKRIEEPLTSLDGTDTKGKAVKFILLNDKKIATIKTGSGKDVEKASLEANGDNSKYLSALMASCTFIDEKGVPSFMISNMDMKDYMNIQIAFSEINF